MVEFRQRYSRNFYFTYSCDEILSNLLRFRPVAVEGHPAYLMNLAKSLKKSGYSLPLKVVISSGDILDGTTRLFLESFFGRPVYDVYGANDVGPIAWQCKQKGGYHLNTDFNVYEFIKDGENVSSGELGNLVITNLYNYVMPLIRYNVEDVVSHTEEICPCGRSLPLLKTIEGRSSDFLHMPEGHTVSPRILLSAFHEILDLPAYQMLQTKPDEVIIRFYSDDIPNSTVQQMLNKSKELLGDKITIKTDVRKEEPRAKIRPIIPYSGPV